MALFFFAELCAADETLPYSFSFHTDFEGWLLKAGERSYFIQPQAAWSLDSQVFTWTGFLKNNEQFTSLPGVNIISATAFKNSLAILALKNNQPALIIIDSALAIQQETKLDIPANLLQNAAWKTGENELLLLVAHSAFFVNGEVRRISQNAEDAVFLKNGGFAILGKSGTRNYLKFFKNDGNAERSVQLNAGNNIRLAAFENTVASLQTLGEITAVELSESKRPLYAHWRIAAEKEFTIFKNGGKQAESVFLKAGSGRYEIAIAPVSALNSPRKTVPLAGNLIEPMLLQEADGKIFAVFRNGVVMLDSDGEILSEDYIRAGEWFKNSVPELAFKNDTLLLSTPARSVLLKANEQPLWFVNRFLKTSGRYILPLILFAISAWLLQRYLRQRAVLHAVVDLPVSGIVIVLDQRQRLLKINQAARDLLKMTPKVPLKRNFRYYCQQESCSELQVFVENAFSAKEEIRRKITLQDGGASEEIVCTALPLRSFTGVFRGFVVTGTDITEELEKKRLVNWAQLAHDMQTNLSVVRLNAEQFASDDEGNLARRKKILFQVGLILQRVRDLVTVGRTDVLDLTNVNSREICRDVLKEFDEQMFPHVEFSVEADDFMFTCDRQKFIRALRNATENAVRALKGKPGNVVLKAWREPKNVCVSVTDTGAGMSEELQKNMFKPFFTTGQHQGGTGIGTMIMQHVAHLHGGEIIVRSELEQGTEIIFTLPAESAVLKNVTITRVKNY